jgi:hypothetical protein
VIGFKNFKKHQLRIKTDIDLPIDNLKLRMCSGKWPTGITDIFCIYIDDIFSVY